MIGPRAPIENVEKDRLKKEGREARESLVGDTMKPKVPNALEARGRSFCRGPDMTKPNKVSERSEEWIKKIGIGRIEMAENDDAELAGGMAVRMKSPSQTRLKIEGFFRLERFGMKASDLRIIVQ